MYPVYREGSRINAAPFLLVIVLVIEQVFLILNKIFFLNKVKIKQQKTPKTLVKSSIFEVLAEWERFELSRAF